MQSSIYLLPSLYALRRWRKRQSSIYNFDSPIYLLPLHFTIFVCGLGRKIFYIKSIAGIINVANAIWTNSNCDICKSMNGDFILIFLNSNKNSNSWVCMHVMP